MALWQIIFWTFTALISVTPSAMEARYTEAEALERADKFREARAAFLQIAKEAPRDPYGARARFRAARVLEDDLNDEPNALVEYQRLLREAPDSTAAVHALSHTGEILTRTAPDKWPVFLQAEIAARPATDLIPHLQRALAAAWMERGKPKLAVVLLDDLAHSETAAAKKGDAYFAAAKAHVAAGDNAGAVASLHAAIDTYAHSILPFDTNSSLIDDSLFLLGRIERDALHDPAAAKKAFEKLVDDYPTSVLSDDALVALREMARAQGDGKGAAKYDKRLRELRPDSRFVHK